MIKRLPLRINNRISPNTSISKIKTRQFLGINFVIATTEEALAWLGNKIDRKDSSKTTIMLHVNLNTVYMCHKNSHLREALKQPEITLFFEGIALKLARYAIDLVWEPDLNGSDLVPMFLALNPNLPMRLALVGGRPGISERAGQAITQQFPNIRIVKTLNGFEDISDLEFALRSITTEKPDILLLGLGTPLQEILAGSWAKKTKIPFIWTVGGLFDLLAGERIRAPQCMLAYRLEWLWRLICQPKTHWQRIFIQGTWLFCQIIKKWKKSTLL